MGIGSGVTTPAGTQLYLQNACFFWVIPTIIALVLVALFMDNLKMPRQSFKDMMVIFKNKHTWFQTWIYTCGFGSFIGYSMALALIIKVAFPEVNASWFAFSGAPPTALASGLSSAGCPIRSGLGRQGNLRPPSIIMLAARSWLSWYPAARIRHVLRCLPGAVPDHGL